MLQTCKNVYRCIYKTVFLVKSLLHLEKKERVSRVHLPTMSIYYLWTVSLAGYISDGKEKANEDQYVVVRELKSHSCLQFCPTF